MEKKLYMFEAIIEPSGEWYEVSIPDLDAVTQGRDLYDAAFMGQDLIRTLVSDMLENGEEVPAATFGRRASEDGYVMSIATDAPEPEREWMGVEDAAGILGVSASRVYAMARDGVLDSQKVGNSVMVGVESVKRRQENPRRAGRPRKAAMA